MKNPSCLIMLVAYPVLAITFGVLFFMNHPETAREHAIEVLGQSVGTALATAFFATLAALWAYGARRKLREVAIFNRAQNGHLPDGEKLVFQGTIQARGPLLRAPISGRECVAYRYRISCPSSVQGAVRRSDKMWYLDAQGFAMTPCRIQGQTASIALLGFPEPWFRPDAPRDAESYDRTRTYARSADFEKRRTVIKEQLFEVQERALRVDEPLRVDHCTESWSRELPYNPDSPDDATNCFLDEQIVAPGEPVAVVGPYAALANGIVPGPAGRPDLRVRLYKGDATALVRTLHRFAAIYGCLALAAVGATVAIARGFLGGGLHRYLGW